MDRGFLSNPSPSVGTGDQHSVDGADQRPPAHHGVHGERRQDLASGKAEPPSRGVLRGGWMGGSSESPSPPPLPGGRGGVYPRTTPPPPLGGQGSATVSNSGFSQPRDHYRDKSLILILRVFLVKEAIQLE